MLTASGSLKNVSLFGEFVYSYGDASEWAANTDWDDKTNIIQATAGLSRYWKDQNLLIAMQYYYDGNDIDLIHKYLTHGHNIALMANCGRLFGRTDITATFFAMANFGKEDLSSELKAYLAQAGSAASYLNAMTYSVMLYYSPINDLKLGLGPYITWQELDGTATASLKLTATLGGGKF